MRSRKNVKIVTSVTEDLGVPERLRGRTAATVLNKCSLTNTGAGDDDVLFE